MFSPSQCDLTRLSLFLQQNHIKFLSIFGIPPHSPLLTLSPLSIAELGFIEEEALNFGDFDAPEMEFARQREVRHENHRRQLAMMEEAEAEMEEEEEEDNGAGFGADELSGGEGDGGGGGGGGVGGGEEAVSGGEEAHVSVAIPGNVSRAALCSPSSSSSSSTRRTGELTVAFEGEVYVFPAVTPDKVGLLFLSPRCLFNLNSELGVCLI